MIRTHACLLASLALAAACSSGESSTAVDGGDSEAGADTALADGPSPDLTAVDAPAPDRAADLASSDAAADRAPDAAVDQAPPDAAQPDRPPPDAAPDAPPDVVAMCGAYLKCDCTYQGLALIGKVKYVDALGFPDVKVHVVTTLLADLYVKEVPFNPTRCGEWQVDNFLPDFKVQKVGPTELADFSIQYDLFQPGLPGMR
jgi:hypothetical protein